MSINLYNYYVYEINPVHTNEEKINSWRRKIGKMLVDIMEITFNAELSTLTFFVIAMRKTLEF